MVSPIADADTKEHEGGLDARHHAVRVQGRAILAEAGERRAATVRLARETVDVLSTANREGARAVDAIRLAVDIRSANWSSIPGGSVRRRRNSSAKA